jgi:hypothetical protein
VALRDSCRLDGAVIELVSPRDRFVELVRHIQPALVDVDRLDGGSPSWRASPIGCRSNGYAIRGQRSAPDVRAAAGGSPTGHMSGIVRLLHLDGARDRLLVGSPSRSRSAGPMRSARA